MVSILLANAVEAEFRFIDFLLVSSLIVLFAVPVTWIKSRMKRKRMKRLESRSMAERRAYLEKKGDTTGRESARTLFAISFILNPNTCPPEEYGGGGFSSGS